MNWKLKVEIHVSVGILINAIIGMIGIDRGGDEGYPPPPPISEMGDGLCYHSPSNSRLNNGEKKS